MTIMSMSEFNTDRAMAGKPQLGTPIPDEYKGSPIENTEHFADPREMNERHQARNERFGAGRFRDAGRIEHDPTIPQALKDRLKGLADYTALYGLDKDLKEYRGYILRRDPTYNYWSIDGIPGMFTKVSFAYDKIDHVIKIIENPELQTQIDSVAQAALNDPNKMK